MKTLLFLIVIIIILTFAQPNESFRSLRFTSPLSTTTIQLIESRDPDMRELYDLSSAYLDEIYVCPYS